MQTQRAPEGPHDDLARDASLDASLDAYGNPVEASLPPRLHDTHHLRLKALLLTIWVVFSFGIIYFARDLQAMVPGKPTAYWMAAQGAILMFLVIIVAYCVAMDHLERQAGRDKAVMPADSSSPHA
ncbi:MAG: DUF4212 domain-containing protein [Comamonas sp.]